MTKLLVNGPLGQELIDIHDGGGYFDPSRVLWDERSDGPMPFITVGGMKLVNGELLYDSDLFSAHQQRVITTKKDNKRKSINAEAGRRIVSHYGLADGKQGNMHKRVSELIRKRATAILLTPAELAEEDVLLQAGAYIDAVRGAAQQAKQSVTAATTVSGVDAVTVNWPTNTPPDWPL